MSSNNKSEVKCPDSSCNKKTPVGQIGTAGLQDDFRVSQIRDAFKTAAAPECWYLSRSAVPLKRGWDAACAPVDLVAITDSTGIVSLRPLADLNNVLADTTGHRRPLCEPRGVVFDEKDQRLLVACHGDDNIVALDPDHLEVKARLPLDGIHGPTGLAVLRDGHIVVSSTTLSRHGISVHNPYGACLRMWGKKEGFDLAQREKGECVFDNPNFIAVDSHDRILVTDRSSQGPLRIYSREGQLLLETENIHKDVTFSGLAVNEEDNILVSYTRQCHEYVSRLSPDGRHICSEMLWPQRDAPGRVRGLAWSSKGMVCVGEKRVVLRPGVSCVGIPLVKRKSSHNAYRSATTR